MTDILEQLDEHRSSSGADAPLPPARPTLRVHAHAALEWVLVRARVHDALGELYAIDLDCYVRDAPVDLEELLGTQVTLEVERVEEHRVFHGMIMSVEDLGTSVHPDQDAKSMLRLHLAPALAVLSRRQSSRVFHHATALEIVRTVLRHAGVYQKGDLDIRVGDLEGSKIRPREYCVQYQETDLAFVRRLLEEEGLTIYFVHEAGASSERLLIVDGASPREEAYRRVDNGVMRHEIEIVDLVHHTEHAHQTLVAFGGAHEVRPGTYVARDHDFSNTRLRDAMTAKGDGARGRVGLGVYEYPGRYVFDPLDRVQPSGPLGHGAYPEAPRSENDNAARLARVRGEELRRDAQTFVGRGNVIGVDAGVLFALRGHLQGDYDREYLVTSVTHDIWSPAEPENASMDAGRRAHGYANQLRALDATSVFRPARVTPRPRIHGAQTAVVVGHPGREILSDWYGRIKVQFHWDQESGAYRNAEGGATPAPSATSREPTVTGSSNPEHLCWVRVAQAWAGAGWGAMFIPRVGMEVVVVFLDGDPDRPLVVGCVYNDANPPPYPLPSDVNVSTIRTRSTPVSPGHERYNELRFDDSAGAEEVFVRAQRDLNEQVGRNHKTDVGEDHELRVAGHEMLSVRGNQEAGVAGNQNLSIGGIQKTKIHGNQTINVEGERTETLVGNVRRVCMHDETTTVFGSRITRIYGCDQVESAGPMSTVIRPTEPEQHDPDAPHTEAEYLESRTIKGSRYQQVDDVDEHWAHTARTVVEESETRTVGKQYTLNVGEEANLLITGLDDPDDHSLGYFMDKKSIRIGTHAKSTEEVLVFRGQDTLHLGKDQFIAQADSKPLELRIGNTGCVIRLSGDGKKIELIGLEEIVLKGKDSAITIGKDITIDAKQGEVTLTGSKINA